MYQRKYTLKNLQKTFPKENLDCKDKEILWENRQQQQQQKVSYNGGKISLLLNFSITINSTKR
jgi:hypothetical protein